MTDEDHTSLELILAKLLIAIEIGENVGVKIENDIVMRYLPLEDEKVLSALCIGLRSYIVAIRQLQQQNLAVGENIRLVA